MKAELYCFDDCPSYVQAFTNLKEALRLEQMPDDVEMAKVAHAADAQTKRFLWSPTIRARRGRHRRTRCRDARLRLWLPRLCR